MTTQQQTPGHDEQSAWAALGGPLSDVLCCVAAASDAPARELATYSLVCKGWHAVLKGDAPWAAALRRQFGYEAQSAEERRLGCRHLLIRALTGRLYLAGQCPAGLGCSPSSARFTTPEHLLLSGGGSDSGQPVSLHAAAAGPRSPRAGLGCSISIRAVAAGADFAVLLTWDGAVLDTRCLASRATSPRRQQQGSSFDWSGLWRPPPGCRPVAVAAGGCWQGSGRAGGHVLVVTDQHTVWAWGVNSAGQLGAGCISGQRSSGQGSLEGALPAAEPAPSSVPSWVAAPLEVVDSAAAAAMGFPVAAACGDEHSMLLCRNGTLWAAGSNAAGACGLPVVQLAAASWSKIPLPAGAGLAAAVSCGGRNTAVVTRSGRLLVCGANDNSTAAVGRQGGCCYLLADVGPSAAWHGMQRTNQLAGGGGGDAANRAVGVACGSGSLYALTSSGEVFSWGQGGQGELGLGGNSKNVCTPSRLPWAHDVTAVAASAGGRFAAVVDRGGRLLTFGAGKSGCLGHGDTAKKAVGRPVKALAGQMVYEAAGGAEWMLVLAGWRPPAGRGGKGSGGKGATSPRAVQTEVGSPTAGQEEDTTGGFRYLAVQPSSPPSPRSEGGLSPASTPSTPLARRRSSGSALGAEADAASTASGSSGSWPGLRGRSGREQRREEKERLGRSGRRQQSGEGERLDLAPEAAYSRRQRWMRDPPVSASPITPPESASDGGSGDEASGSGTPRSRGRGGGRSKHGGSDHHMAYLLRRQLKAFSSDPRQRQLVFPAEFSSRDRWQVHLMAEARGLMHESVGEGGERRLVVWKPSRSRRSLKPSMLEGAVGDGGSSSTSATQAPASERQ